MNRLVAYDRAGPALHSVITINPRALETAGALDDERRARGPRSTLHCIPVLLKDNIDTFDMPTTNGSAILRDAIPPDDAALARALRDSGALILIWAQAIERGYSPFAEIKHERTTEQD